MHFRRPSKRHEKRYRLHVGQIKTVVDSSLNTNSFWRRFEIGRAGYSWSNSHERHFRLWQCVWKMAQCFPSLVQNTMSMFVFIKFEHPLFFPHHLNTLHRPCINVEIQKGKQIFVDQKQKFNNSEHPFRVRSALHMHLQFTSIQFRQVKDKYLRFRC